MLKTALLAGAFACLSFAVNAAECEYAFDDVMGQFSANGVPAIVISDDDLPGIVTRVEALLGEDVGDVTRGFFVQAGGQLLLGLEVDGCLINPISLGYMPTERLSGRNEAGEVGA